ncbi:RagB/SusD family nutrient uptake outer membrane protein [Gelidibacter salicanalis]|uniref:RagB/SusD family nutrient uptake outer membrane protein n=1 Tax=Gelidibacter salicanalis TaxID=291193 RepID=A0A934KSX4_9FLAO|nr:RagB/SusD family nutrient uptake outer membrane protein [Gelidibacter salicanalis]MBJ7882999.1 RagB/SusD family nutrient uptake outer membrane protein [Gelidibacter salicanalis]
MKRNKFKTQFWTRISTMVFSVFIITSCSNLDENPDEVQLNPANLTSDDALAATLTGMYRNLIDGAKDTQFRIAAFGGDDLTTHSASNKIAFRESDWRRLTSSSSRIETAYNTSYNVITLANIAIEAQSKIISTDKAKVDRLIGEAYFMRAFSYMHLTKSYGRVPLQLVPNSNEELSRASFVDIYTQIEADLVKAEELLPNVFPGIPVVGARPNKGTAKAFLSRLYLMWGGYPIKDASKYALAASKAKEVIDNEGTYGFGLTNDFRALWTEANRFNQNESVFALVSCVTCGVHNRTMGRLGLPAEAGGWNETFGEVAFFEDMEADASANGTEKRFNDTYVLEVIPRSKRPLGADWRTWVDPHPVLRKIAGGDLTEPGANNTLGNFNIYFMRYAEVLLNYAEAVGRSGGNDPAAWDALNRVRTRAGATSTLTSADGTLTDLAFMERKWEFAGEFLRMHDLVRTETLSAALANRSPKEWVDVVNNTTPITSGGEEFYFTPIPQAELDIYPGLNN